MLECISVVHVTLKEIQGYSFFHSKECQEKLEGNHREEMTSLLQANKLTIDAVKSQAEQRRLKDIDELTMQHENDQGLRTLLSYD